MSYLETIKKIQLLQVDLSDMIEVLQEIKEEIEEEIERIQLKELYNGKVVCIESKETFSFTKGKIYEFKNGITTFDTGNTSNVFRNFIDITKHFGSKFIEVIGEGEEPEWKAYNGRVICIKNGSLSFKKGKIYTVKKGVIINEKGVPECGVYGSFEELQNKHTSKFIEIVGDEEDE